MHLYETHIPVADTRISEAFYRDVVGLPFAYRDPTRDIVFMWVDEKEKAMLGLWGPGTRRGPQPGVFRQYHFAFAVSFEQLLQAIDKLKERGIETFGFDGPPSREPSVSGGCRRPRSISKIPTGTGWNTSPCCRILRTQVLSAPTRNGQAACSRTKGTRNK